MLASDGVEKNMKWKMSQQGKHIFCLYRYYRVMCKNDFIPYLFPITKFSKDFNVSGPCDKFSGKAKGAKFFFRKKGFFFKGKTL